MYSKSTPIKYPSYEDCDEPCYLHASSSAIQVTYQMKSIISHINWRDIKHLKPVKLKPDAWTDNNNRNKNRYGHDESSNRPHSTSTMRRRLDTRHNILKIRLVSGERKLFHFDSAGLLEEFLADAIKGNLLTKVVGRKLLTTKVKYLPVNGESKGTIEDGSPKSMQVKQPEATLRVERASTLRRPRSGLEIAVEHL